jgi:transcriptional regulator with XRE-family HTH domain
MGDYNMALSMGQIIKKLRKERNLTQEELAEQLNVTFQAVSKWENDTGMPDISQVVPLASVFKVNTDVLFGTFGTDDDEEVLKIIKEYDKSTEIRIEKWHGLQNGLKKYPNHTWLLMAVLEYGIALAYPENDCYDEAHGEEIYRECTRAANLVISYSKNATDILRAHMIMVLLHSAYGNSEKAREHVNNFPERSDFTLHNMSAWVARAEKNHTVEAIHLQKDFSYHLTAMLDDIILLGKSYRLLGKHDDALKIFFSVFSFMEVVFGNEKTMPPVPNTDSGDIYVEIARTYLDIGDNEKALDWLEKMVDYDINTRSQFKEGAHVDTPFLRDERYNFYCILDFGEIKKRLLKKLNAAEFDCIKNNERFIKCAERIVRPLQGGGRNFR